MYDFLGHLNLSLFDGHYFFFFNNIILEKQLLLFIERYVVSVELSRYIHCIKSMANPVYCIEVTYPIILFFHRKITQRTSQTVI
jgi:hypothetical protein